MSEIRYHTAKFDDLEHRILEGEDITGGFAGYGSIFDVTDSYGTRMRPGCFRAGGLDDQAYALLWMHDAEKVIGTFRAREDEKGLWIEGKFAGTTAGQDARVLAQMGAAPELSVGFVRQGNQNDDETAIVNARLVEVSLITARMASTPGAALVSVRHQLDDEVQEAAVIDGHLERQRRVARVRLRLRTL